MKLSLADLKNQIQENETKLNDFTINVDSIFVKQVSMREDIQVVLESMKLLAASVSSLSAEVTEHMSEKSSKVRAFSFSMDQHSDSEELNIPKSEPLNSSCHLKDLKGVKKKKLRRLSKKHFLF